MQGREIDMRAEVLLPEVGKQIIGRMMPVKGAHGAVGAVRKKEFSGVQTVIEGQQTTMVQSRCGPAPPGTRGR